MSLSVAVETRRAMDSGLLPNADESDSSSSAHSLRVAAIAALKAAQQRLEQALSREAILGLPDFYVLMIESRTWAFFHPTPKGFDPNCVPTPPNTAADDPAERDVVIVASERTLREVVSGRLPFATALQENVMVLDADEKRFDKLSAAWNAAYPSAYSRFVCA